MKTRFIFMAFVVLALGIDDVFSQESDDDTKTKRGVVKVPALAIKWSPLHLAYFYPSFQVAIEHKVFRDLNFQYDFGYVMDYPNGDSEDYSAKRGYRIIGQMR